MFYKDGIYYEDNIPSYGDHAITILGFNEWDNTYFIKNSWGSTWGISGFGLISEDAGLCQYAAYPTFTSWYYIKLLLLFDYPSIYAPTSYFFFMGPSSILFNFILKSRKKNIVFSVFNVNFKHVILISKKWDNVSKFYLITYFKFSFFWLSTIISWLNKWKWGYSFFFL